MAYENLAFAVLAMVFAFMSTRPHKKVMDIPLLGILYRVSFIVCVLLSISQAYNITSSLTTFVYSGGMPTSANSVYTYQNQGLNQDFDLYALGTLAFLGSLSILLEYFSDVREYANKQIGKVFKH